MSDMAGIPDNTLVAMGTQAQRNLADWTWRLKDARERLAWSENMVIEYTAERDAIYQELDDRELMPVEPKRESWADATNPYAGTR